MAPDEAAATADENLRTSLEPGTLARAIVDRLFYSRGALPESATTNDWYQALAGAVRDRLIDRWVRTVRTLMREDVRVVSYLSAEFLTGPHLGNNLVNLGIEAEVREAVDRLGLDLDRLVAAEEEPGLGNGGLGRLAACFLDSLATLEVPAIGYGVRYEFGIFDQVIRNGWQVETTDKWLAAGNPWEIPRPERACYVGFGGQTDAWHDETGRYRVRWRPSRVVRGIAHDTPIVGYRVPMANLLRLWRAEACESFDFSAFNVGDYYGAVDEKVVSENLTKVLYPNDEAFQGKRLRLEQQFFLVSCSLQDMIRIHIEGGARVEALDRGFAIQLNDTHPSIAVAELMRLLVDEYLLPWEAAWGVTRRTLSYTNHTLLPEALETWPRPLFASVLPRHLEIIHEINHRFLDEVRQRYPGDDRRVRRLSLIGEEGVSSVRMAHLAVVGSNSVNGVAALHTELLKQDVLADFYDLWPERFRTVTNGVTPRRWVALANPGLTRLLTEVLGEAWLRDGELLRGIEPYVGDAGFGERWRAVKRENKVRLAALVHERTGIRLDPDSLFDIQAKRLHEYKRQHLNALGVIALYNHLRQGGGADLPPRTVIFAGKAAPGYRLAKLIIRLINGVADVVNADSAVAGRLAVAFVPDFNVTTAQVIYPAADLSEQISTAGMEASGTGNMKFAMNGGVTIGTLDGANVELRERVGPEQFFLFGLRADEVARRRWVGHRPLDALERSAPLAEALDQVQAGRYSGGDREVFRPLVEALVERDDHFVLEDFDSYTASQAAVADAYGDRPGWTRLSILNTARSGWFSSDRAIRQYCEAIWHVAPVRIDRV